MANLFYFGTAERMAWLPTPKFNMPANNVSWRASGSLLNGGAFARSSTSSHMEYQMAWPLMSREESYSLIDYFNGLYGDGPFYFIDPVAREYNVLPNWMAAGRIQTADGPSLIPGQTPALTSAIATTNGYPARAASYTLAASQVGRSFTFPVPPGYTFRFGWHGVATGTARVRVVGATTVDFNALSPTGSAVRFTTASPIAADSSGFVTIQLIGGASGGLLILRGMQAAVLPTAIASPSGDFVSGRGNSGMRLNGDPSVTEYSAVLNNVAVGVSANFIETGAWE